MFDAQMLSVDVPPYGTGTQPITYHVRVNAGYGHLEAGFRRIFDGRFAGWMYVDGILSPGDYTLTDWFNTNELYYSEYKFVEDAAPPPPQVTLTIQVQGNGTTDPAPGVYTVTQNSSSTVTANPTPGNTFVKWVFNGTTYYTQTVTVVVPQNMTLTAYFEPVAPPPPQTIQARFFTLPAGRMGQKPSDYAAEDLHGTITVDGVSYATPVTIQLTVGATVNLSAPGAVDWDYYGMGHVHSPEASYTVVATATEFAAFYEEAPPPPPPPPPPTLPLGAIMAAAGVTLLLVLGGVAVYLQRF